MTKEEKVEILIAHHLNMANQWLAKEPGNYTVTREDGNFDRGSIVEVTTPPDGFFGTTGTVVFARYPTDNDSALGALMGVFEQDDDGTEKLVFAAQEIDTMWGELYAEGELRGTPDKLGSWNEGYDAGFEAARRGQTSS